MDVSMYRPNAARRGCLCMIINMTATMQPSKTFTYIPVGLYDTLAIRNYDLNTVHERFHKAVPWATMSDWEATVEAAAASWSMHFTVNYCQICRTAVGVIELVRSVSFRVSTCMALKISHSTKLVSPGRWTCYTVYYTYFVAIAIHLSPRMRNSRNYIMILNTPTARICHVCYAFVLWDIHKERLELSSPAVSVSHQPSDAIAYSTRIPCILLTQWN